MIRRMPIRAGLILGVLLLTGPPSAAQEDPFSVSGDIITGVFHSETRNGNRISNTSAPLGFLFDINGYLGHPDFISFNIKPSYILGDQAPQAGFPAGNGVQAGVTFFRRRAFPFTVRYITLEQETIAFGARQELSGFRSVSDYRELSFNGQFNFPTGTQLFYGFSDTDSDIRPDLPLLPNRRFEGKRYDLKLQDQWGPWGFNGQWNRRRGTRDNLDFFDPNLTTFTSSHDTDSTNFTASRNMGTGGALVLSAGERDSENVVNGQPYDVVGRYARANSTYQWGEKWQLALAASYDNNRNDLLREVVDPTGAGTILEAFQTNLSTRKFSSDLSYKVHNNWSVYGGVNQAQTRTEDTDPISSLLVLGTIWGSNAGIGFHRETDWGNVSSGYGVVYSNVSSQSGATPSNILGQQARVNVRGGSVEGLELSAAASLNLNRVESDIFLQREDLNTEAAIGHRFGLHTVRGGIGFQKVTHDSLVQFNSEGWTARVSVENHIYNAFYSRRLSDGSSFFFAPDPGDPTLPGIPIRSVLSSSAIDMAGASFTPTNEFQMNGRWSRLRQTIGGALGSRTHFVDLTVNYHFRKLTLEGGYSNYEQILGTVGEVSRGAYFFRLRRSFELF